MFRNYWKIAVRQLGKQKFYSFIKIGGFALGIATCLLITLYIRFELSFDRDYPNRDRLYRVVQGYLEDNGTEGRGVWMQAPFAKAILKDFPQVEQIGRIMPGELFYGAGSNEVRPEGRTEDTYEEGFTYADQSVLDMFGIRMIYGDRARALTEPASVVLSKRKADKYFPGQDPVGKVLYLNGDMAHPYKIGGVMSDPPVNSHLQYDFLISLAGHELWKGEQDYWGADNYPTYALLRPGVDPVHLQTRMGALFQHYLLGQLQADGTANAQSLVKRCSIELQPVKDIHLRSGGIEDGLSHGDIRLVWLFGAVGVFILLLACINFVNLSTARSASRAREVGLRKVVGSPRSGLIAQFLTESLLLSGISIVLAIGLAWLFLPLFDRMTDTRMEMPWSQWWFLPTIILTAAGVGLLAGWYPAVYLSRFRPVEVLKGAVSLGGRRSGLRSVLVVFQFTTSAILIVCTLVIYRQMNYILNRKMGYDKDQVMLIQGTGTIDTAGYPHKRLYAFKNELLGLWGVKKVTISDFLPVTLVGKRNQNTFWREGRSKIDPGISAQDWYGDQDYFATLGMKILKGRTFLRDMASDSSAVVINERMASKLGWADPLGKQIDRGGSYKMHIIGVVADFNSESIRDSIGSIVIHRGDWATIVAVKANTGDMRGLIKGVQGVWKRFEPRQDFRYTFLDETYARMYADVQRTQSMFTGLSVLAIVIACLGLFALSAYMAERRRKEVGIRKALGASVSQVTELLTREFVVLVLISILIATSVAWWGMHAWLQDYTYRIGLGWGVFAAAGFLVLGIALLTMGTQAVRAARASPAGSLRTEG